MSIQKRRVPAAGGKNDVEFAGHDRQKAWQQRLFIEGDKPRNVGQIGRHHVAVQFKNGENREEQNGGKNGAANGYAPGQKCCQPNQPADQKAGNLRQEKAELGDCAEDRKFAAFADEHQPAHQHIDKERGLAIIDAEAVQPRIGVEGLDVCRKDTEDQKGHEQRKSQCAPLRPDCAQNHGHERGGSGQHRPLRQKQQLRLGKKR
ncbi:hypothetical protein DMP28_12980 [Brucella abortus]|nr:hypothetical protein DMP28_12980 [Brucella abortus]